MEKCCDNCAYIEHSHGPYYKCIKTHKYIERYEKACDKYVPKEKTGYTPSGCYITTIVCNILGKNDNDEILNTLRSLRDDYLVKNENYIDLLNEYDQIGPIISRFMLNDSSKFELANLLYETYLTYTAKAWKHGNFELAIKHYKRMIKLLKENYELEDFRINKEKQNPIESLGHGQIRISEKKE